MSWFFHHLILLFITLNVVNASRWWRDTGYDDLIGDSPEPFATHPPKSTYQKSLDASTPPLNATTGTGIYHLFAARQVCPNLELHVITLRPAFLSSRAVDYAQDRLQLAAIMARSAVA